MLTVKKSLGQHFLRDEQVLQRIVAVLREKSFHRLLEVGPGPGALTKWLVEIPDIDFKCIEIDREKVDYLRKSYPQLAARVIEGDILKVEMPFENPFTIVGNFPYNISTQILFRVLDWKESVEAMIGMFQKEVAQRIASREGSKIYGVTSVLVQSFFNVEYLFEVDETAFAPPPKVKSAVIRLTPLQVPVRTKSERAMINLVKSAFSQRRKTLRNSVKSLFAPDILQNDIFTLRPEQLSVSQFAELTFQMNQ